MKLTYKLISKTIPEAKGFVSDTLEFQTVSFCASANQPKGLFIPLSSDAENELNTAIANGAIGAIWEKGNPIPSYTPNHFPIFYSKDRMKGIKKMIQLYEEVLQQEETETKFIFSKEKSLNNWEETYDIAVITDYLTNYLNDSKGEE